MRVTMKDIARLAKVSQSTVSLALKGDDRVKKQTMQRIRKLALEMNYEPNAIAMGLKSNRTNNIAFIYFKHTIPFFEDHVYSRIFEGIENEAAILGYHVIVCAGENSNKPLPTVFLQNKVDGALVAGTLNFERLEAMRKSKMPLVLVGNYIPDVDISCVVSDNFGGGARAAQYLVETGHRRIAYIGGDIENQAFRERFLGFSVTLNSMGIELPADLIITQQDSIDAFDAVQRLLTRPDRPTGLFCANDLLAISGMKAVREVNLRIPEDISLIGFDDISIAGHAVPPLSTFNIDPLQIGRLAVVKLRELIEDNSLARCRTVVGVRFVQRESCMKPARKGHATQHPRPAAAEKRHGMQNAAADGKLRINGTGI